MLDRIKSRNVFISETKFEDTGNKGSTEKMDSGWSGWQINVDATKATLMQWGLLL